MVDIKPEGCDLPVRQNSDASLRRLAAFSYCYGTAKSYLALQIVLAVPAAIAVACLIWAYPSVNVWTAFYAFTVALLDVLILDRIQKHYRNLAARSQEMFDVDLFGLEWNGVHVGKKPDLEDEVQAAAKYRHRKVKVDELTDWYPRVVGELDLPLARLICQRANCWWDASLRRKYAYSLVAILCLLTVGVLAISLYQRHTVELMILTVYAPLAPAALWSVREALRHKEASDRLDRVRDHIETVWSGVLDGTLGSQEADYESRNIQDQIFDGRMRNPLIFDWVNRLVRKEHEASMNEKAKELVMQAKKALGLA